MDHLQWLLILLATTITRAQLWMAMAMQSSNLPTPHNAPRRINHVDDAVCRSYYLNRDQREMCRNYTDLMESVSSGIRIGAEQCQTQFRNRKWNCTTVSTGNMFFGKIVDIATRETAFISGIVSAGVAYKVAETCFRGHSAHCRCTTPKGFDKCSQPIEFGAWFSQRFIDLKDMRSSRKRKKPRKEMNLHNNRAGRLMALKNTNRTCICHGVSGSCAIKHCERTLNPFKTVGHFLKEKYNSAHEMKTDYKIRRNGKRRFKKLVVKYQEYMLPTQQDFIYYEKSPEYCYKNKTLGVAGTSGRECRPHTDTVDSCQQLCCGRQYVSESFINVTKCRCEFKWCCRVICKECRQLATRHTCK